jgi:hypothetical protein
MIKNGVGMIKKWMVKIVERYITHVVYTRHLGGDMGQT